MQDGFHCLSALHDLLYGDCARNIHKYFKSKHISTGLICTLSLHSTSH